MRHILLFLSVMVAAFAAPGASAETTRPLVAVIDSGIARTAELTPSLIAEYDLGSDAPRPLFQPAYDHGTMVATILLREAHHQVDIVSLRIDDPAGCPAGSYPPCQESPYRIADAIRKAGDLGVKAINMSLHLSDHPAIIEAAREVAGKGVFFVLAAGNQGLDHPGNLAIARATYPNSVIVGAVDGSGRPWSGTNRPDEDPRGYVYSWQPGVDVPTVGANGLPTLGTGTSLAAPVETARLLTAAMPANDRLPATAAPPITMNQARLRPATVTGAGGRSHLAGDPSRP